MILCLTACFATIFFKVIDGFIEEINLEKIPKKQKKAVFRYLRELKDKKNINLPMGGFFIFYVSLIMLRQPSFTFQEGDIFFQDFKLHQMHFDFDIFFKIWGAG